MKRILFAYLFAFSLVCVVNAQTDKAISEKTIQLTPDGYITLEKDVWAYMNYDMMDAWSGIIEPLDKSYRIKFWSGIIVPAIDESNKNIQWKKQKEVDDGVLTYSLEKKGHKIHILGQLSEMNFFREIQSETEIEKFLEVISKYRSGRCKDCFNSITTRRIVRFIERKKLKDQKIN